jgi:hypothetical protein
MLTAAAQVLEITSFLPSLFFFPRGLIQDFSQLLPPNLPAADTVPLILNDKAYSEVEKTN